MKILHQTETFQAGAKRGHLKYWLGRVLTDGTHFYTQTEASQDVLSGGRSSPLISTPKRIEGKNLGRSNATSPEEQARRELDALVLRQRDKGYTLPGEQTRELLLPMLAHPYEKYPGHVQWPAFVQPKLDGARCLYGGRTHWSRQGKPFLPQVVEHLHFDTGGLIFDGELLLPHEEFSFQQTIEAIKKFRPKRSPKLLYCVYDLVMPTLSFAARFDLLREAVGALENKNVRLVPTAKIADHEELLTYHGEFTQAGYEGTMIRNAAGKYLVNHRSQDLLKYKDFQDAEYPIVEVLEGEAKETGHAIFVCRTPDGKTFRVRPRGTSEERQRLFRERQSLIGRELKVRYQNLSDDGIPRFPVGVALREPDIEG